MNRLGPLVLCLAFSSGCATQAGRSTGRATPTLPLAEIQGQYSDALRSRLEGAQIGGWVIMEGIVRDDGTVSTDRIAAHDPDSSRDALAREFAKKAVLRIKSTGSFLPTNARVHVIFYGRGFDERIAVIHARPQNPTSAIRADEGSFLEAITH